MSQWRDFRTDPPTDDAALIIHAESADPKMPLIVTAWFSPDFGLSLVPEMWIPSITHWMPLPEPPTGLGRYEVSGTLYADPSIKTPFVMLERLVGPQTWDQTFVWDELMQWHGDKPACPGGRCRPQKEAPEAHAD